MCDAIQGRLLRPVDFSNLAGECGERKDRMEVKGRRVLSDVCDARKQHVSIGYRHVL